MGWTNHLIEKIFEKAKDGDIFLHSDLFAKYFEEMPDTNMTDYYFFRRAALAFGIIEPVARTRKFKFIKKKYDSFLEKVKKNEKH